jgi:hypothetical protein
MGDGEGMEAGLFLEKIQQKLIVHQLTLHDGLQKILLQMVSAKEQWCKLHIALVLPSP